MITNWQFSGGLRTTCSGSGEMMKKFLPIMMCVPFQSVCKGSQSVLGNLFEKCNQSIIWLFEKNYLLIHQQQEVPRLIGPHVDSKV